MAIASNKMTEVSGSCCLYPCESGMANLAPRLGQIDPKWDKSGTFYDQVQYILARHIPGTHYEQGYQFWPSQES